MGLTVQSMSVDMQKQVSETNLSFAANRPADKPAIFPGQISSGDTRTARHERSIDQTPRTSGNELSEFTKNAETEQKPSREKRGQVLGACSGSGFRDCRGGDALEEHAATHTKFDQFKHDRTRGGADGKGSCQGIVYEAMRRIDHPTDGASDADSLPSAVQHMNRDMDTLSASNPGGIYDRIDNFQGRNARPPLANYHQSSSVSFDVGGNSRATRINDLIQSLNTENMPAGGLAYIRLGIQSGSAMGPETNGHALLAQRLPDGNRYTLFDPNNGVFTYNSLADMRASLSGYLQSAFTEDGNSVAPDSAHFYTPPTARDWGSAARVTDLPPPAAPMPEPAALLQHFGLQQSEL